VGISWGSGEGEETILQRVATHRIGGIPSGPSRSEKTHWRAYTGVLMCMQCIAGAMAAGAGATGLRAWLAVRLGPRQKRALTGVLVAGGVLAAGLVGPTP